MRKSKLKRVLSILLILALTIPMVAIPAFAAPISATINLADANRLTVSGVSANSLGLINGDFYVYCVDWSTGIEKNTNYETMFIDPSQSDWRSHVSNNKWNDIPWNKVAYIVSRSGYSSTAKQCAVWYFSNFQQKGYAVWNYRMHEYGISSADIAKASELIKSVNELNPIPDMNSYSFRVLMADSGKRVQPLCVMVPRNISMSTVSGRVWIDANNDSVQTIGEGGRAGVTVELQNRLGVVIGTTVTDDSGVYRFSAQRDSKYTVHVVKPEGATFVQQDAGAETVDSDVAASGDTAQFTLSGDVAFDAGLEPRYSIGDWVWEDLNGNKLQDDGEPGFAGVPVSLKMQGPGGYSQIASTVTDATGHYVFTGLKPEKYKLVFGLPSNGYYEFVQQIHGNSGHGEDDGINSDVNHVTGESPVVDLRRDGSTDRIDAGLVRKAAAAVTVYYRDKVTKAEIADGETVKGLLGLPCNTVQKDIENYAFDSKTPAGAVVFSSSPQTVTYYYTKAQGKVVVRYLDENDTLLGGYEIGGDVGSGYQADSKFDSPDFILTTPLPDNASGKITKDPITVTYHYKRKQVEVTGYAFKDENASESDRGTWDNALLGGEPAVAGLNVTLSVNGKDTTVKTDAFGKYAFDVPVKTSFLVSVGTPDGSTAPAFTGDVICTTANQNQNHAGISEATVLNDVGFYESFKAYAAVKVFFDTNKNGKWDDGEQLIPGVSITDSQAYGFTNGSDYLTIQPCNLSVAVGNLPTDKVYVATSGSDSKTVSIAHNNRVLLEFGYYEKTVTAGSVTGKVFFDKNKNGAWDAEVPETGGNPAVPGEKGLAGVTVKLLNGEQVVDTAVTDADGQYSFSNVEQGAYTVEYVKPLPSYEVTAPTLDGGSVFAGTLPVEVKAGEASKLADVGYWKGADPTAVHGTVFFDVNGNGVIDADEIGLKGVTVKLMDGSTQIGSFVTVDGGYNFAVEKGGDYTLTFEAPEFYHQTVPQADLDGNIAVKAVSEQDVKADDVAFAKQETGFIEVQIQDVSESVAKAISEIGVALNSENLTPAFGKSGTTVELTNLRFEVPVGTYTVAVTDAGKATLVSSGYTLASDAGNKDSYSGIAVTAGATVTQIMKYLRLVQDNLDLMVFKDANNNGSYEDVAETGFAGCTVEIFKDMREPGADQPNFVLQAISVTDKGDGHYTAYVKGDGKYQIRVTDPKDYTLTTANNTQDFEVLNGVVTLGKVGYFKQAPAHNVIGHVYLDVNKDGQYDAGDTPLAGVELTVYVADGDEWFPRDEYKYVTGSDGYYGFLLENPDAQYQVRVTKAPEKHVLSYGAASNDVVLPAAGQQATVGAIGYKVEGGGDSGGGGSTEEFGDVHGLVFNDANGNGKKDAGELGLTGVTMYATCGGSTYPKDVDGGGVYEYKNVPVGNVTIEVKSVPEEYTLTTGNKTQTLKAVAKADTAFADIGYWIPPKTGSLNGLVFNDANNNGVRDSGEAGISGVKINLASDGGSASAVTNAAGAFAVPYLKVGKWTATVDAATVPQGYGNTTSNTTQQLTVAWDKTTSAGDIGYYQPQSVPGGGSTPTPTRDHADQPGPLASIPSEPTPLAAPKQPVTLPAAVEPKQDETVVMMPDEIVPLGIPVLPKTGESSSLLMYLLGLGLIGSGGMNIRKRPGNK